MKKNVAMPWKNLVVLCLGSFCATTAGIAKSVQYAELLRCQARNSELLGEHLAATVCRGVDASSATAVDNCVRDLDGAHPANAIAVICQGIRYNITTATLNCFADAIEMTDQDSAASLCQKTNYQVYTTKIRCFSAARDSMADSTAAMLCGGIAQ